MEYFFKQKNSWYQPVPPMRPDCLQNNGENFKSIQIIYPENGAEIFLPIGPDGNRAQLIVEVAARNINSTLYWHLDENFIATTNSYHKLATSPSPGKHIITITNQNGQQITCNFTILEPK